MSLERANFLQGFPSNLVAFSFKFVQRLGNLSKQLLKALLITWKTFFPLRYFCCKILEGVWSSDGLSFNGNSIVTRTLAFELELGRIVHLF